MILSLDVCGHGSCHLSFLSEQVSVCVGGIDSGKQPLTSRCLEKQAEPGYIQSVIPQPSSPQNGSKSEHFCIPEQAYLNSRDPEGQSYCIDLATSHWHPLNSPKGNHQDPLEGPGTQPSHSSKAHLPVTRLPTVGCPPSWTELPGGGEAGPSPASSEALHFCGRVHVWHAWSSGFDPQHYKQTRFSVFHCLGGSPLTPLGSTSPRDRQWATASRTSKLSLLHS